MGRPCPEVSNNIYHLYVCMMLLKNDLLTISMGMITDLDFNFPWASVLLVLEVYPIL